MRYLLQALVYKKLAIVLIKLSILLMIIALIIGEGIAPSAAYFAKLKKTIALSRGQAIDTLQGLWIRDGNLFIHIDQVLSNGTLQAILLYEFK